MTNVPSGSKRPWEGSNGTDISKRPREDPSATDWRDVHLKSPHKPPLDKRSPIDRRRDDRRPRSSDYNRRRSRDYSRDRNRRDDRDRDRRQDRDKHRDRDRYRDRESTARRGEPRRDDQRKDSSRLGTPISRSTSVLAGAANGTPRPPAESEREEGE